MARRLVAVFAVIVTHAALLEAQQGERSSRWGVTASVTPQWTAAQQVQNYVGADEYDISGADFTIGFVRGRDYSGEWGVSFVRRSVREGATSRFGTRQVCFREDCVDESTTVVARDVSMLGLEAHQFFALATIRRRIQFGLNVAGGVVRVRGTAERTDRYGQFVFDPATGTPRLVEVVDVSEVPGGQIFTLAKDVENVLSVKLELGVGIIITRSLKVRVGGGIDFPGYHVASVSVVYLFGRPGPESIFR